MNALIAGSLLAVGALCYVLYPLFVPPRVRARTGESNVARAESASVEALRDLEFDRATGKISDADYEPMKARYTARALNAIRAGDVAACDACGPRPEPDARYCSRCGAAIAA